MWLIVAALLAATLAAYYPAWHGGMVWDDESHVTSAELQPVHGLARIWFELGATQQYYPVVHSAFWIQHRLWGDVTLGYHLVNILLHVLSSALLLIILRRLKVPGAVLAAVVFALHPVHVESVAWITELKNTLSGAFILASALAYLRFDRERAWRAYAVSAALFCLALLSKSVTATLPGVLLVVFWWQRGRLGWRRDVVPLVPFFVVGAAAGLFTAWVERTYLGAQGAEFQLTVVERGLVASRAIWFYLGKLFWPSNLMFVYPRWEVSQAAAWQYAYPVGAVALVAALWLLRTRTRAPLAAMLAFAGILFPALGFLNVYPFRFSFVADHFQYLASIPIIALASAGAAILAARWVPRMRWATAGAALALAAVLGSLTWHQSAQYADGLTLYRATLQRNPSCWLAHSNLGALLRQSEPEQALRHLTEAVRLKPDSVESHYNLATAFQQVGRSDEALSEYDETIRLEPRHARAYYNRGNVLQKMGRLEAAERSYRDAIRLAPDLALAHSRLGRLLQMMGRPDEALRACETAVRLQPGLAVAHRDLAGIFHAQGRLEEAVREYGAAVRLEPGDAEARHELGSALQQLGRFGEAIVQYREGVRLDPRLAPAQSALGTALQMIGRPAEALEACETAVRLQPDLAMARYDLANVLQQQGRLKEAVEQYAVVLKSEPDAADVHCSLAAALRSLGLASEARQHDADVLRLAGNEADAHVVEGASMEALGRLDDAKKAYERALEAGHDPAETRHHLARIDALIEGIARAKPVAFSGPAPPLSR